MKEKNTYVEDLDRLIGKYCESPCSDKLFEVICMLFIGLTENRSLPCAVEMTSDEDELKVKLMFYRTEEGKDYLSVFTQPDGEKYGTVADIRFRALISLIYHTDDCEGIMFNTSGGHEFFAPKSLFICALAAGYKMAKEETDEKKKSTDEQEKIDFGYGSSVKISRPVNHEDFEVIEDHIRNLTCDAVDDEKDDFVVVELIKDKDDLLFVQTIRHDMLWYVELAFDMKDFGWKVPLIIGAELELEEAVDLFRQLLEYGVSADDISIVQERFRDIGFTGADEDK